MRKTLWQKLREWWSVLDDPLDEQRKIPGLDQEPAKQNPEPVRKKNSTRRKSMAKKSKPAAKKPAAKGGKAMPFGKKGSKGC